MDSQMGISHEIVLQLQEEGITIVNDPIEFETNTIYQIAVKLWHPARRVP